MAQYKDVAIGQKTWIHELAKGEMHPEADRLLQLGQALDPRQKVEESTIEFLTELNEAFQSYAQVFNGYSEAGGRFQEVKIYSIAQSAADFMLYRNQIKLVVANTAQGVIQIAFSKHSGAGLSVDGQTTHQDLSSPLPDIAQPQELIAEVSAFLDVHWTFRGERVLAEQVARFYFSEFVRLTRSGKKTRGNDRLLVEQIRTLLHEKGIEI